MHGAKPAEHYMADLLVRKESHFVLWRPYITDPAPKLLIGKFQGGQPPVLKDEQSFVFAPSEQGSDLWEIAAQDCHLNEGEVYHYWLEVTDTNPYKSSHPRVYCTDPTAWAVDWRLLSPPVSAPSFGEEDRYPASVVLYQQGKLVPCDPDGQQVDWKNDPSLDLLPANNQLVIYELPASWARKGKEGTTEIGRGSFRDVIALIEPETSPANFAGITAFEKGHAHLRELGINALELLPCAGYFTRPCSLANGYEK